jgi:hypothetical protein
LLGFLWRGLIITGKLPRKKPSRSKIKNVLQSELKTTTNQIKPSSLFAVYFIAYCTTQKCPKYLITKNKQEGHDGPEVAHLYIGPRSGASLNPRAFI